MRTAPQWPVAIMPSGGFDFGRVGIARLGRGGGCLVDEAFRGNAHVIRRLRRNRVAVDGGRFPHVCSICFRFRCQHLRIALGHAGGGCGGGRFLARGIDPRQADCIAGGQGCQRHQRSPGKQVAFHSEIPFWNTVERS